LGVDAKIAELVGAVYGAGAGAGAGAELFEDPLNQPNEELEPLDAAGGAEVEIAPDANGLSTAGPLSFEDGGTGGGTGGGADPNPPSPDFDWIVGDIDGGGMEGTGGGGIDGSGGGADDGSGGGAEMGIGGGAEMGTGGGPPDVGLLIPVCAGLTGMISALALWKGSNLSAVTFSSVATGMMLSSFDLMVSTLLSNNFIR
jgi:hypothetical protein